MIEINAKTKKWGNSLGILLDKNSVKKANLKENEKIKIILLKNKNVLKETFGTLKFKKSTEQMMREIDKDLDSKFF